MKLLTRHEVAKLCRCSVRTIDTAIARGEIAYVRIGGVKFIEDDVLAYIASKRAPCHRKSAPQAKPRRKENGIAQESR